MHTHVPLSSPTDSIWSHAPLPLHPSHAHRLSHVPHEHLHTTLHCKSIAVVGPLNQSTGRWPVLISSPPEVAARPDGVKIKPGEDRKYVLFLLGQQRFSQGGRSVSDGKNQNTSLFLFFLRAAVLSKQPQYERWSQKVRTRVRVLHMLSQTCVFVHLNASQ